MEKIQSKSFAVLLEHDEVHPVLVIGLDLI